MFSWLFKKRNPAAGTTAPANASSAATAAKTGADRRSPNGTAADPAARQADQARAKAEQAAARAAENWARRLQQALGNDAALLELAGSAPGLDIKLAAVAGLAGEDALRQAERAFRTRDRKVHRLAKSRLGEAVSRRTTHAAAEQLLQRGQALLQDPQLPLNHLAAMDREWEALPAALLDPVQQAAFTALRGQLDSTVCARLEADQQLQRWTAHTQRSLPIWQAAVAAAASQPQPEAQAALADVCSQAQALLQARPESASTATLAAALTQLLDAAHAAQIRVDTPPPAAAPSESPELSPAAQASAPEQASPPAPGRMSARESQASAEQCQRLDALLQQADTALAEGRLADLQQHLQTADALLAAGGTLWPVALRQRRQALRAEQARLKGWQAWGGARARADLIGQAQALARRVRPPEVQAVDTAPPSEQAVAPVAEPVAAPGADEDAAKPPSPRPKLPLRAHADAIRDLRMRWKALDKLGEGASHDEWQAFDGALTVAYQPVAEQNAAQQAARQRNLLSRQALLDTLEALTLPAPDPGMPAAGTTNGQPDWRELARQLDAFQAAWRQLGPIEHTAPADARQPLAQRLQVLLHRTEEPLRHARERAAAEREQFIRRAQALADGRTLQGGELQRELRALQADWQDHARSLPLARGVENALWLRFRAATDAVLVQRDAAAAARERAQAAELAEREALIERLRALSAHTPATEIASTLADVDRAWQQAPAGLPRATGQALEGRYRAARAKAGGLGADAVRLRWHAQVDAWTAAVQSAAVPPGAGASPAHAAAAGAVPPEARRIDDLLLQLEIALDLPAAPEWQAARRQLKLRALKEAMEGRNAQPAGRAPAAGWLGTVLGEPALDDVQRQRLLAVLTALRDAEPGTLGLAVRED